MTINSSEESQLSEEQFQEISQRKFLTFSEYTLVMIKGLMRQWGIANERAKQIALSRYPMSTHSVIDELATRGLRVTLPDFEEYLFQIYNQLCDPDRLQWEAKAIEIFVFWAVANERAVPIEEKTPHIQRLLRDREFVTAAREIEQAILNSSNVEQN